MAWSVIYTGDARFPERTRPYLISGFPPFPVGKPVLLTEDDIARLGRGNAGEFLEFLFGEGGVYNANHKHPHFALTAVEDAPTDEAPEGEEATEPAPAPSKGKGGRGKA